MKIGLMETPLNCHWPQIADTELDAVDIVYTTVYTITTFLRAGGRLLLGHPHKKKYERS